MNNHKTDSGIYQRIRKQTVFEPPNHWLEFNTIDMHTGGEPLRVILTGYPDLDCRNVLEYRSEFQSHWDHLRTSLMLEPRGHADMYGCILVRPNKMAKGNENEQADFGIVFMHNEGYSTMCGHAIIAITTLAVRMEWFHIVEGENHLKIDTPCGRIDSFVDIDQGKIADVRFRCVPSFVVGLDRRVSVEGVGDIIYDLAFGGAFYAYVDLIKNKLDLELSNHSYQQLVRTGMSIKRAIMLADHDIQHPFEDDLSFLYGTIFVGPSQNNHIHSRNVCVFADGEVDRSPTGSGVSGRMAIHYARGEIDVGEKIKIESITGSVFESHVYEKTDFGPFPAVIPQVSGSAFIVGANTFLIDPDDPIKHGFLLR